VPFSHLLWREWLLCFIEAHQPEAWHLVVLVIGDVQVVGARALDALTTTGRRGRQRSLQERKQHSDARRSMTVCCGAARIVIMRWATNIC
jgi:hypothetical protein